MHDRRDSYFWSDFWYAFTIVGLFIVYWRLAARASRLIGLDYYRLPWLGRMAWQAVFGLFVEGVVLGTVALLAPHALR